MTNDSVECVPSDFDELTAFVVACDLVTCILAIGGNLLVIISVLRYRELRTPTNYFVVALAFADLIVGLNIPFYISFYFNVSYACDFEFCLCRYFLALWGSILSGILMTGVAADRYIAVVHPLRYSVIMTARLAHIVIFVVYVYVSLLVSLPFFWDRATKNSHDMKECDLYFIYTPMYALIGVVIHVLVTLVATIVLYARIFKEAWRQRSVAAFPQINIRQEARTTVMMILIFGVNILSLLPYIIVVAIRYFEVDENQQKILSKVKKIVVVLFFGKSSMNPLIYGWKNKAFRSAFRRLLQWLPRSWHKWKCEAPAVPATNFPVPTINTLTATMSCANIPPPIPIAASNVL